MRAVALEREPDTRRRIRVLLGAQEARGGEPSAALVGSGKRERERVRAEVPRSPSRLLDRQREQHRDESERRIERIPPNKPRGARARDRVAPFREETTGERDELGAARARSVPSPRRARSVPLSHERHSGTPTARASIQRLRCPRRNRTSRLERRTCGIRRS